MWSEEPWQTPEQEAANEACRKEGYAFPKPSKAQQEAYIERMIKRDREYERVNERGDND